ncbi:hypothetical protein ACFQZJ_05060 [Maribacter chungangensis]|uniref:Uncharacterized protein n=1 Tax=Maribacter chungangensis TaxID=1069117 RepID=A0ABW3B0K9_9FLAO
MSPELLEFIKTNFIIGVYFVTLLISIVSYIKYFDTVLKYFPILIAYTLLNELLGHLIRYSENFAFLTDKSFANDIIYNIYDIFYYSFFYLIFWKLISRQTFKKWIKILSIIVLGSYIVSCFFQNPLQISLYYATSFASVILVVICILYLIDKGPNWEWHREKYNLVWWVSVGLILFHSIFPILFLLGFLGGDAWEQYELQTVLRFTILIMYMLFCIGFIKSRKRNFS